MKNVCLWASLLVSVWSMKAFGQMSSLGPGKSQGFKSIYTHPQAPKPTPYDKKRINPGFEVPLDAQTRSWRLVAKTGGSQVPIYTFRGERRSTVAMVDAGEVIQLDEIRGSDRVIYYKYAWNSPNNKTGGIQDFWVSGNNLEYVGSP